MTEPQRVVADRRRSLELARSRAESDLTRATVPAHRRMLQQTLDAITQQLASLD